MTKRRMQSDRALLNLILRERWRASRLPSVPSALRDQDPHQPLSRKLVVGAPDTFTYRGSNAGTRNTFIALRTNRGKNDV